MLWSRLFIMPYIIENKEILGESGTLLSAHFILFSCSSKQSILPFSDVT